MPSKRSKGGDRASGVLAITITMAILLQPALVAAQGQVLPPASANPSLRGEASDGTPVLLVPYDAAVERLDNEIRKAVNELRAQRAAGANALVRPLGATELLSGADPDELAQALSLVYSRASAQGRAGAGNAALTDLLTPAVLVAGFAGLQSTIDELLNHADAIATSQLFAMRSHVAATVADLNVVFRNNMDDAYEKLGELQRKAFSQAQAMLNDTTRALKEMQESTFEHAANLLCDLTAQMANFPVKLISFNLLPKRAAATDMLCLYTPEVRDAGSLHEQLLRFRGVNLTPGGEYADATLSIPSQPDKKFSLSTAGGNTILMMPMPGGINGDYNDVRLRGDLVAQVEFAWAKANQRRRWLFMLKPFLVRSVEVSITPLVERPVYSTKADGCYVYAKGGSLASREESQTCTITVDQGAEAVACEQSEPTTHLGDAGISSGPLQGPGSCQWVLRAKSEPRFGKSAWHGINIYLRQRAKEQLRGMEYRSAMTLNQGNNSAVFTYDMNLVPSGARIVEGQYWYTVTITDNTGNRYQLTESKPSDSRIGTSTMDRGKLTISLATALAELLK